MNESDDEHTEIMDNPGELEDILASRDEYARGEGIDGMTALAPFSSTVRAQLQQADAQIAAGDLGTPLADVVAELDAEEAAIGPLHGPPRERGQGWERVRADLVRALTTEPLDRERIAGLAETLDIMLTPGETEATDEGVAEIAAGLDVDGPTTVAALRSRRAEEEGT